MPASLGRSAKSEHDPVGVEEEVLRKIPNNPNYCNPENPLPVSRLAFKPWERDALGISVFRSLFCSCEEIDACSRKPGNNFIALLEVAELIRLALRVVPDPDEDQPAGHSLIPELNYEDCKARERERCKEIQHQLAKLASKSIIWRPRT